MHDSISVRTPVRRAAVAFAVAGVMAMPAMAPATAGAATSTAPLTAVAVPNHAAGTSQVRTAGKKRKKARFVATVETGPTVWRGKTLKHPRGIRYYPNVLRWAKLVRSVMREHNIPRRYLRGIMAQIQQESAGIPDAVNRWDSNWRRGTPSKGLLQIIKPTYKAHAKPGYRRARYMKVPYTNVWASLNYVKRNYGMWKFRSWNKGYNQGY